MKNRHRLVRSCVIGISIAHLGVFISFFFPYSSGQPPYLSWRIFVQIRERSDLSSFIVLVVLFVALGLPPLAAWAASRSPGKLRGLPGIWVSLPLTLVPVLGYLILVLFPGHGYGATRASWILPIGFGLSFLLCLTLALSLPLLRTHEQVAFRSERPEERAEASGERLRRPDQETRLARAGKDVRLPIFASLGLLSHLLILQSLFWTYIDYYDVYQDADLHPYGQGCCLPTASTGWQLLSQAFLPRTGPRTANMPPLSAPQAIVWLATLVLPALIYLSYLVLFPFKRWRKNTRLRKSIFFGFLLNIMGLSISCFWLMISLDSHGEQPIQNTYPAFALPPAAFLLSLIWSGLLIKSFEPVERD